jgi:hypothetical protein
MKREYHEGPEAGTCSRSSAHAATRQQFSQPQPECLRERGQADEAWLSLARPEKLQPGKASRTSLKFSQTLPILDTQRRKNHHYGHSPARHARESRGLFLRWSKCGPKVDVNPHKGTIPGFDWGPITRVYLPVLFGSSHSKGEWLEPSFCLTFYTAAMPEPKLYGFSRPSALPAPHSSARSSDGCATASLLLLSPTLPMGDDGLSGDGEPGLPVPATGNQTVTLSNSKALPQ